MAIGSYPDVGLKYAREFFANGKDLGAEKKRSEIAAKMTAETTFLTIGSELIEKIEREAKATATLN